MLTFIATAEVISVGLTIVASWLALELGLKFRIPSRILCFLIKNAMILIGKYEILQNVWNRCSLLHTRNLRFKLKGREAYRKQITDGLRNINSLEGGVRMQLRRIYRIDGNLINPVEADETGGNTDG